MTKYATTMNMKLCKGLVASDEAIGQWFVSELQNYSALDPEDTMVGTL